MILRPWNEPLSRLPRMDTALSLVSFLTDALWPPRLILSTTFPSSSLPASMVLPSTGLSYVSDSQNVSSASSSLVSIAVWMMYRMLSQNMCVISDSSPIQSSVLTSSSSPCLVVKNDDVTGMQARLATFLSHSLYHSLSQAPLCKQYRLQYKIMFCTIIYTDWWVDEGRREGGHTSDAYLSTAASRHWMTRFC